MSYYSSIFLIPGCLLFISDIVNDILYRVLYHLCCHYLNDFYFCSLKYVCLSVLMQSWLSKGCGFNSSISRKKLIHWENHVLLFDTNPFLKLDWRILIAFVCQSWTQLFSSFEFDTTKITNNSNYDNSEKDLTW